MWYHPLYLISPKFWRIPDAVTANGNKTPQERYLGSSKFMSWFHGSSDPDNHVVTENNPGSTLIRHRSDTLASDRRRSKGFVLSGYIFGAKTVALIMACRLFCTQHWTNVDLPPIVTSRLRQNCRYFADDKCIFLNENVSISLSLKISLKFVPKDPINDISVCFQKMAWRRPSDKSLFELMIDTLMTPICVARPQRVKPRELILKNYQSKFRYFHLIKHVNNCLHNVGHLILSSVPHFYHTKQC